MIGLGKSRYIVLPFCRCRAVPLFGLRDGRSFPVSSWGCYWGNNNIKSEIHNPNARPGIRKICQLKRILLCIALS
ncbi:hypothetical protein chiPu_0000392 [Chiloscyllium punctatum]|uniref:Uncharacterized protein n=1 Tax=Chiloscyllium punctatum TaxID=137246 RepID=A0A401RV40_CHIPU|nr:hypothetical protein [Chiloscyllium punctatum]